MARKPRTSDNDDEPKGKKVDPIIQGLFGRLPASGKYWPETDRKTWLNLIEAAFKVIYKAQPETADEPDA